MVVTLKINSVFYPRRSTNKKGEENLHLTKLIYRQALFKICVDICRKSEPNPNCEFSLLFSILKQNLLIVSFFMISCSLSNAQLGNRRQWNANHHHLAKLICGQTFFKISVDLCKKSEPNQNCCVPSLKEPFSFSLLKQNLLIVSFIMFS